MQLPALAASGTFDEACDSVLAYLRTEIPMGFWSVTRHSNDDQLYLAVEDSAYGRQAGDSHRWSESMCQFMAAGEGPQIAPDVEQVEVYATAGVRNSVQIGAYVGLPLVQADGSLFGTLCGLDPATQPVELERHAPLLQMLAQLLSGILQADLMRTAAERLAERSAAEAETDSLTGLYNRRAWDRFLAAEEARYRRFGHAGSVVILDLDSLKLVNDEHGHAAGDEHLRQAARTILHVTRGSDIVARLGGDEFGILAADMSPQDVEQMVERLSAELARDGTPGSLGHASYTVTAGFPGAWRDADAAMYRQKRERRSGAVRRQI